MFDRVNICGLDIDNISMPEAIEAVKSYIESTSGALKEIEDVIGLNKNCMIIFLNVDVLMKAQKGMFKDILTKSHLLLADGIPLLWAKELY